VTVAAGLAGVAAVLLLGAGAMGWQHEAAPVRAGDPSGVALDGAALFRAKGCATCHVGPDSKAESTEFPDLSNAAAWAGRRRSGYEAEEYLRESIRDPGVFTAPGYRWAGGPVSGMPTLTVSDAEVDALIAYLLAR
jgi:cytochrome c551/c552